MPSIAHPSSAQTPRAPKPRTPKPRVGRVATVRAVALVLALLAALTMSVSPAAAQGREPVTSQFGTGFNGLVDTRISFVQERQSQAARTFLVVLNPVGGGDGDAVLVVAVADRSNRYTVDLPPTEPGRYNLVIEETYIGGDVVTNSIPMSLGGPPRSVTGRSAQSGEALIIEWAPPAFGSPNSYTVTTRDFVDGFGAPPKVISVDVTGNSTFAVLNGLSRHGNYSVQVVANYDFGTGSTNITTPLVDPNAPVVTPNPPTIDDQTKPTIDLTVPSTVNRYGRPGVVQFTCADDFGVDTCEGTHTNGERISTARIGSQTVSVTATDFAGNTHTETATVDVSWAFEGQYAGVSGNQAIVARYYAATFGRLPDRSGFNFWVSSLNNDANGAEAAAQFFATSPEFQSLYGESVSNTEFVDTIYVNVLGRAPEGAGRTFWIDSLNNGAHTRGSVMSFFANSPEHMTITGTS